MANSAAEIIRPLRRAEYEQLVALGAFHDERIELLDGALVAMSPIGRPHSSAVQRLNRLLILGLEGRAAVTCQSPFAANELSEPEPDFLVFRSEGNEQDHPSEAYLVVEVADSSLSLDRGKKLRLYASCSVPEYWIVNLDERCIEVYTGPTPTAYSAVAKYEPGQSISLVTFPDVSFAVSDVLT